MPVHPTPRPVHVDKESSVIYLVIWLAVNPFLGIALGKMLKERLH